MKKLVFAIALGLTLAACSTLQTLQQVTGTTVSPTQAIVAANAFDAAESAATAYLVYCKSNLSTASCSAANRRSVIQYTRAGRAARNQIETAISTNTSVPAAIYNSLVSAVTSLKASPAANGGAQ
jgi:hypothetical protein